MLLSPPTNSPENSPPLQIKLLVSFCCAHHCTDRKRDSTKAENLNFIELVWCAENTETVAEFGRVWGKGGKIKSPLPPIHIRLNVGANKKEISDRSNDAVVVSGHPLEWDSLLASLCGDRGLEATNNGG